VIARLWRLVFGPRIDQGLHAERHRFGTKAAVGAYDFEIAQAARRRLIQREAARRRLEAGPRRRRSDRNVSKLRAVK